MKLPLLLVLTLAFTACDQVLYTPDATPIPAPVPAATPVAGRPGVAQAPGGAVTPPGSPAPKPGDWMWQKKKGALDQGGGLNSTPGGSKTKK